MIWIQLEQYSYGLAKLYLQQQSKLTHHVVGDMILVKIMYEQPFQFLHLCLDTKRWSSMRVNRHKYGLICSKVVHVAILPR